MEKVFQNSDVNVYTHILLRCGEIFLKGKNRPVFENKLIKNIKKIVDIEKINKLRSRYIVDFFDDHKKLKKVFGLVSYSLAIRADKDVEDIKSKLLLLIKDKKGTFKVNTKRSDKQFPIKSPDLNAILGDFVGENNSNLEFSLKEYEYEFNVEINQDGAYLFLEKIACFGGLPTGVEGESVLLLKDEASILAGLLIMKRGVKLVCFISKKVSFDNVGLKEKCLDILNKFSPDKVLVKEFEKMKEITIFMNYKNIGTIILGQNLKNYNLLSFEDKEFSVVVLRPLIAFSDQEIQEKLNIFEEATI